MKLLLDTNIFLEIILDQERASEVKNLLVRTDQHDFYLSDYSLHSIGLLLFRRNKYQIFQEFVRDVILDGGVGVLSLAPSEMGNIAQAAQKFSLDFDDAYQYTLAMNVDAEFISFDKDFNRTNLVCRVPSDIL
jgi:hypothetical protein